MKEHVFKSKVEWTGDQGSGTFDYRSYSRDHEIQGFKQSEIIHGSSGAEFLGDAEKYCPEELLVASLSACHMLWYLHLCSKNDVIVTSYKDQPSGIMEENTDGSGKFREVTLNPIIQIEDMSMREKAQKLHADAHKLCFISNSVNFEVNHKVNIEISS